MIVRWIVMTVKLLIRTCASITRFCNPESFNKQMHEIALDSNGKRLLVTSGLVRAPIYQVFTIIWTSQLIFPSRTGYQCLSAISLQVQGHESGLRTLPHSSSITSVDWHPTLPMYITGSADHSVRVTSIIWSRKQGNHLKILSLLQCNQIYYCWKQPVKVTTCFPVSASIRVDSLILVGGFWCHFFVFMSCSCALHFGELLRHVLL